MKATLNLMLGDRRLRLSSLDRLPISSKSLTALELPNARLLDKLMQEIRDRLWRDKEDVLSYGFSADQAPKIFKSEISELKIDRHGRGNQCFEKSTPILDKDFFSEIRPYRYGEFSLFSSSLSKEDLERALKDMENFETLSLISDDRLKIRSYLSLDLESDVLTVASLRADHIFSIASDFFCFFDKRNES